MGILAVIQQKLQSIFGRSQKDGQPDAARVCKYGHAVFAGNNLCNYGHHAA